MNLDRDLPISIRAFGSDFRYFFPLYLSIITQDYASILAGNNLSVFKRLPFIFTEPTYYWGYTMPIGFLMFFYKSIPYKLTMSIFLLFCGLISYSTYGIITVLFTCLLLLLIKNIESKVMFLMSFFILLYLIFINAETIFSIFIPSKLSQFKLYSENVKLPDIRESFLVYKSNLEMPKNATYGALENIFRYGYLGFFTYLISKLLILNYVLNEKVKNNMTISDLTKLFPLLFVVIYSFKIPQLSIYTDIILLNYYEKNKE